MPTYPFECKQKHITEKFFRRVGLRTDSEPCAECGEDAKRVMGTIGGFWHTQKTGMILSNGKGFQLATGSKLHGG